VSIRLNISKVRKRQLSFVKIIGCQIPFRYIIRVIVGTSTNPSGLLLSHELLVVEGIRSCTNLHLPLDINISTPLK